MSDVTSVVLITSVMENEGADCPVMRINANLAWAAERTGHSIGDGFLAVAEHGGNKLVMELNCYTMALARVSVGRVIRAVEMAPWLNRESVVMIYECSGDTTPTVIRLSK